MDPISNLSSLATSAGSALASGQSVGVGAAGAAAGASPVGTAGAFTQSLTDAIGSLSGLQATADAATAGAALNNGLDIHQAMIAMQQASLGMQLATQVRDKAVEAYQTLMNMQM